jgi:hypothetical protein
MGFQTGKNVSPLSTYEVWLLHFEVKGKGKVTPLQARCGPEGGYRYSSTLP